MPLPPLRLRSDNFTPASRTPWGGRRLVETIKAPLGASAEGPVGESWELSLGPEFPSSTEEGVNLCELSEAQPDAMLGGDAQRRASAGQLLVKWIDAGDDLSLQIHPDDAYRGLAGDEAGKPECWYVVQRAPGAGLFVGLAPQTDEAVLRAELARGGDLRPLLRFRPVEVGDFVLLPPGTPHAIGAGVMLIEAQRVLPGRRGVTYRYWDWGRRYAPDGRPSPDGAARELHLEHAIAVTRWNEASDPACLAQRELRLGSPARDAHARLERMCGPQGDDPVSHEALRVARLYGVGATRLPDWNALCALTVVEGRVRVAGIDARAGMTLALPACVGAAAIELDRAHALLSAVCA